MQKTWFITASSGGFGAKIARRALAAGHNVVATARKARAVVDTLGEHPNLLAVELDVTDESQARAAVQAAVERFGRIDVLVNNAGNSLVGAIEEASLEDVERLFRTNVFGVLAVTRAVLPVLRRQRSGHIINFSSVGGYQGGAGSGVYCSTKFAVEGLSEALADEVRPLGIQVTIVEPGYFRTDLLDFSSLAVSPARIEDYAETARMRQKARKVSRNHPGDPDKLAAVVVRLADHRRPPLRLALGSDTVAAIEAKNRAVQEELAYWRELSLSTDDVA
jgi:NAD(P)-dependent dehydrogenase (short-subunit alcohol dehydrogenase family)